ncbi:MAG: histidinol-phosphate transaminase [Ruminococcaceae bacterium]|nr:histidinol-phosphate transaminase [Oscillospiraceae bacterium]
MVKEKNALSVIAPYVAGKPIDEVKREFSISDVVKLASNENPYGASPLALKAAKEAIESLNIYPDSSSYDLRNALSKKHSLDKDMFVFGTGSDGIIELICKTFIEPGDEAVIPFPSFSLYETNVTASNGIAVRVPLGCDFAMDLDAMKNAITDKTKIIWLCNPNNPTGAVYGNDEQREFIESVSEDILIVIDEAYYEYALMCGKYPDSQSLLNKHKNIIILRTFSKIFGLAALRVGYAMADKSIISSMDKIRAPFNVNSIAQAAAIAALSDTEFSEQTLKKNEENKLYLYREFDKLGMPYIKSYTNFVMVDTKHDSLYMYVELLKKGYIVKGGHVLGMDGYLRVTIGTKEECEGFIGALKEIINQ